VILPFPPRFFPVPSYASARFFDEAERWLRAVAQMIAPRLWPAGPIVAVQVDNELTLFLRDGAYDQDYHPDAIAQYRAFLAARYGDALPAVYGGPADRVEPPRRFTASSAEELVPHLDWVAFKDALILGALERCAAVLRDAGVQGVPLTHNYPAVGTGSAHSVAAAEQVVDLVGLDLYQRRRSYRAARRSALQLAGQSRLPFVAELGWGGWPWWFPQALPDQLAAALTSLMHGARGLSFYMAVERDRWFGAPVSATGEPREPRYETTRRLVSAIGETALPALQREVAVALMRVAEYEHLTRCTSLADPLPSLLCGVFDIRAAELCAEENFGLAGPVQCEQDVFVRAVEQALDDLEVPYHLVDSAAAAADLARYRVLVVPAFDFVDPALLARLADFVAAGGALALGPRVPTLDCAMRPLAQAVPPHRLLSAEATAQHLDELLAEQGIASGPRADRERVHVARYDDSAGEPAVVFVANAGDTSCTAALSGVPREGRWFWDAISGDPVDLACLNIDAHQVRMIRVRRQPPAPDAGAEGAR
jgi:beta-galactosidase